MERKGRQKKEARRFPVIRLALALVLLTASLLLAFWRGSPPDAQPAAASPENAPEVIRRPLPESDEPPEPQPQEKAASRAMPQPEKAPARAIGEAGKNPAPSTPPEPRGGSGTAAVSPPIKPQYRKARLFFAAVDAEGRIALKSVIRPVPIGDSPLLDTLGSLLTGPTPQEINLGLLSMIPGGSRMLSATVKRDVAFLNFNEAFRYNKLGVEGQVAQLRQVVYAATEFSNVKKVQILIEGKKVDFLGTEGIAVGKPLDRDSFPN